MLAELAVIERQTGYQGRLAVTFRDDEPAFAADR